MMNDEIARLSAKYGAPLRVHESLPDGAFDSLRSPRTGEVAMVVLRKDGKVLLNTKDFYPDGAFRIPTGGIRPEESVEAALLRETKEEMNLDVAVERFLATVTYDVPGHPRAFTTYVFLLRELGGELRINDPDERISGWREVDASALKGVAERLAGLAGEWRGWGVFRSVVHRVVGELLG